jgi:hypothetical protein
MTGPGVNPDNTSGVPVTVPGSGSAPGPGVVPGSGAGAGPQVQTYQTHVFAPVVTGAPVKKSKFVGGQQGQGQGAAAGQQGVGVGAVVGSPAVVGESIAMYIVSELI